MSPQELTEKIGDLIAQNKIDLAIKELKTLFGGSPKLKEVLLQSAKYNEVMTQISRGTISYENSNMTKNQIRYALLGILNDIDTHSEDPEIKEEISKFVVSGQGIVIQQQHSGSGDNVGRDKIVTTTNYKMRVGIIVATIILATAAAILFPILRPKPVPLTGFVVSSANKPVDGAKVVYTGPDGKKLESFTDISGQFKFLDVNTKKVQSFSLKAFDYQRNAVLDTAGKEGGLQELQIKLPPGDPPFDVSYYNLKEEAITWLVRGVRKGYVEKTGAYNGIDDTWEKTFRGKPFVINNPVLEELKKIDNMYPEGWRKQYRGGDLNIPFRAFYDKENQSDLSVWAPLIQSDNWVRNGNPLPADTIKMIIEEEPSEMMDAFRHYYEKLNGATLSPGKQELAGFVGQPNYGLFSMFSYISRNFVPEDFMRIKIVGLLPDGCIESSCEFSHPKISVEVAVIENNTATGIELDSFHLQVHNAMTLRLKSKDDSILLSQQTEMLDWYPKHRLAAGEKLMIPLRIVVESNNAFYGEQRPPENYWVYGPSYKIEKVDVGIERFAFRQKDPNSLLIYNGASIGSCPYAYTYNPEMDNWQLEDHFLFNVNSPEKETYDTIYISQFDGRLQIRELDPETSHIDFIEVHHITEEGEVRRFSVQHQQLSNPDSEYFIMNQGDEITLTFKDFVPLEGGNYFLISRGYYEVYE